jgi:hypothetical protein
MTPTTPISPLRRFNWKQFLFGFSGWLLVNTIAWLVLLFVFRTFFASDPNVEGFNQLNILPFCCIPSLINLGLVIFLFIKFRPASFGWAAAHVLNALVLLVLSFALDKFGLVGIPAMVFGAPAYIIGLFLY